MAFQYSYKKMILLVIAKNVMEANKLLQRYLKEKALPPIENWQYDRVLSKVSKQIYS
jgi:hypothetical protein